MNKKRYVDYELNLNLDLTYITSEMIAMGNAGTRIISPVPITIITRGPNLQHFLNQEFLQKISECRSIEIRLATLPGFSMPNTEVP